MISSRFQLFSCILTFLLIASSLSAQEWPEWRGPARDGVVDTAAAPASWPATLNRTWQATVGEGHASPILTAGRLLMFARQQESEVLLSLDPADGSEQWRASYESPYEMNSAAYDHGKGPKSTPLSTADRVVTLGINGVLSCFELSTGAVQWRHKFSDEFGTVSPLYGTAMSPILHNGTVIAAVGGENDGAIIACDLETGERRWKWRTERSLLKWSIDGPGYASPIIAEFGGVAHLVTFTQRNIIGLDPETGAQLWQIEFETPWAQNIVTPLLFRGDIILSGLQQDIRRIRVDKTSRGWVPTEVWKNSKMWSYMSSPILLDDVLVLFTDRRKGMYVTMNPVDGSVLWQSDGRTAENAALLSVGDHMVSLQDDGRLIVSRRDGDGLSMVRQYEVATTPTWAHPVILNDAVFVKDKTTLARWELK